METVTTTLETVEPTNWNAIGSFIAGLGVFITALALLFVIYQHNSSNRVASEANLLANTRYTDAINHQRKWESYLEAEVKDIKAKIDPLKVKVINAITVKKGG